MKRIAAVIILSFIILSVTAGCAGNSAKPSDIADKTYVYEKDGFGGDFTVTINSDGSFEYYEGALSSYIGIGAWELNGNALILSDDEDLGYGFINNFVVDGESLIFSEKNSNNFLYIKVSDKEKFLAVTK